MEKEPRKPRGGVKNKLGFKNINYLVNVGKTTSWFVLNLTKYSNRYVKSFDTFEQALQARNQLYYMYGLSLPIDDIEKYKKIETTFLKK